LIFAISFLRQFLAIKTRLSQNEVYIQNLPSYWPHFTGTGHGDSPM
jgi:hypothetical protein